MGNGLPGCGTRPLGDEAFARAWAEGQAMTLEQAVEYALRDDQA